VAELCLLCWQRVDTCCSDWAPRVVGAWRFTSTVKTAVKKVSNELNVVCSFDLSEGRIWASYAFAKKLARIRKEKID